MLEKSFSVTFFLKTPEKKREFESGLSQSYRRWYSEGNFNKTKMGCCPLESKIRTGYR